MGKSGKVKILNDKTQHTRVPYVKTHQANCFDLGTGLEKSVNKWSLDKIRTWSPAIENILAVSDLSPLRSGNRAIIDYKKIIRKIRPTN